MADSRAIPRTAAAAISLALLLLGACATPERAHDEVQPARAAVSAVTVTFSDHLQELAAADPRLTTEAVASAIESELQAHQRYRPGDTSVHRTLSIRVEDFSSELSNNATLFGYTFRHLMLVGTVQVLGDAAAGPSPFDLHARISQRNRDPGASAGSLAGLYRSFAAQTLAALP